MVRQLALVWCSASFLGPVSAAERLDPDVIVLGGGLSNIQQLYAALPALVGVHVFSDAVDTPMVRAAYADSSGVRGAAWLWPILGAP
jgi:fructokinase